MIAFDDWATTIAKVSTRPEFQTATVRITNPALVTEDWDVDTNETITVGNPEIYEGPARIIGIRWGVFSGGESQANATTIKAVRVQIPQNAIGRVPRGCFIQFIETPKNPALTNMMLPISSGFQGSSAAARTFECSFDEDSVTEIAP